MKYLGTQSDNKDLVTKKYADDNVVANPTLAGTESNLTGIEVGGTKYKVPSGGGSGSGDMEAATYDPNSVVANAGGIPAYVAAEVESAKVLIVTLSAVSSLPQTVSNADITADMVALKHELSSDTAQIYDGTWTTAAGSVTISGTLVGSTDITLYLIEPR